MCRLAAFPPGTSPDQAHEIVTKFVKGNDDGVGSVYVEKGEFKVSKYPYSYNQAVAKGNALFEHMPYGGWTLAHVRFATHGKNEYKNTHPIIKGNIAVVHNGVFGASTIIRHAMADSIKWSGDTDTEVAAYMLSKHGAEGFYKIMDETHHYPGVFLALGRDGKLTAVKIGGDLEVLRVSNETFMLASEYPWNDMYRKSREASNGVLKFDPDGHAENFKFEKELPEKKDYWSRGTTSGTSTHDSGNYGGRRGTYTPSDVGFANLRNQSSSCNPCSQESARTLSKTSDVPVVDKKKKRLELWSSWPTEEELSKMEFE